MTTPFFLPQLIRRGDARAAGLRITSIESPETIKARLSSPADAFGHNAYSDVDHSMTTIRSAPVKSQAGKERRLNEMSTKSSFAAWIGLDWGDQCHWVCLRCEDSDGVELFPLEQKPTAIHQWVAQLRVCFAGRPVAIALEQSRGALRCPRDAVFQRDCSCN